MKSMITSYLASPPGQKMIQDYLSSPEGKRGICEFVATPKGRETMKLGSPEYPQLFVPASGSPVSGQPKTQRNSLVKLHYENVHLFYRAGVFPG